MCQAQIESSKPRKWRGVSEKAADLSDDMPFNRELYKMMGRWGASGGGCGERGCFQFCLEVGPLRTLS